MTPSRDHVGSWRAYRWWSRAFWLAFLAYLPALALADRVVRRARGDAANTTTLCIAVLWMIAFAVAGYRKSNFSCPRCGGDVLPVLGRSPVAEDVALEPVRTTLPALRPAEVGGRRRRRRPASGPRTAP